MIVVSLINFVNILISSSAGAAKAVINLLPGSPIQLVDLTALEPYIANINWFFPIRDIVTLLTLWLAAMGTYYAYQAIMRVKKIID